MHSEERWRCPPAGGGRAARARADGAAQARAAAGAGAGPPRAEDILALPARAQRGRGAGARPGPRLARCSRRARRRGEGRLLGRVPTYSSKYIIIEDAGYVEPFREEDSALPSLY